MKVAIDVSPLYSGHAVRGVGFYLKNLLVALKKYHPEHEYVEFLHKIPKDVDVIHYPYFDPFSVTLPLFSQKPLVITIHDLTPLVLPELFPVGMKGIIKWNIQKFRLRFVSRIITDSETSKNDIVRLTGISSDKIDSVYLAAGEEFGVIKEKKLLEEVKKKYHLPDSFALYVGDATPNKNVLRLAKACLEAKIPLVIAGKVFTDETIDLSHPWVKEIKEIRGLVEKNAGKILTVGFVPSEDLAFLYNLATVFVMPSLYEGFGLPVVEAFSCGTPVVCSDKGSLKEVAGDAAYIVDPENIDSIAQGIQEVVNNKKLAEKLVKKGMEKVKEFSWEKTAEKTIASYKKAMSS